MTKQQCRVPRVHDALGRVVGMYANVFTAASGIPVGITATLEA